MSIFCERKGSAAVAWIKGSKHTFYEDRYRLLTKDIPLLSSQNRGEIFAVFDGIGSAPRGRQAAQQMADTLLKFYQSPKDYDASLEGIHKLLMEGNAAIYDWGFIPGTDVPIGGCAGTVIWLHQKTLHLFHAGDTSALLTKNDKTSKLTHDHQMEDGAIYRYFGLGPNLQIDTDSISVEESDKILLLSDGVTKVFHPMEAADFIEEFQDICTAVKGLAQRSQARGSTDDITVMLIEIEEPWEY